MCYFCKTITHISKARPKTGNVPLRHSVNAVCVTNFGAHCKSYYLPNKLYPSNFILSFRREGGQKWRNEFPWINNSVLSQHCIKGGYRHQVAKVTAHFNLYHFLVYIEKAFNGLNSGLGKYVVRFSCYTRYLYCN